MGEKSAWGNVVYTEDTTEDEESELGRLMKRARELRNELSRKRSIPLSMERIKEINNKINEIEKEIYDLMRIKKQASWFKHKKRNPFKGLMV